MGVPGRVVEVYEDGTALVEFGGGVRHVVDASTSPEPVRPGDYVIVHAGIVISRLDPEVGEEYLRRYEAVLEALLSEMGEGGSG